MQKKHITSIYKEYTTPSRVLRSFTNLANTVIQTALSGQSKFVFEILQNADDAYEDEHKSIDVKFILHGKYLIVHHNGKGFDFNDVERICDYASQIEEVKATDLRKTGYKGLGFKSLFNLSDCIYIYSNGYSFRFDKGYWPTPDSKPWQVIPIWCKYEELPLHQTYSHDQPVNIILKVKENIQLESQLREIVEQPDLLLYLFRINKLSVSLNNENYFLERRIAIFGNFNRVDFYKNQEVESTWLTKTYTQPVSIDVQTYVQGASRFIYPEKIKNAKEVTFTFALRSDETVKEISKIKGLCYSTLPTQLYLTLPYHINSLFILNLDRTQLHENEWNEYLVCQLGYLQFNLLKDLANVEYLRNNVIQLFVREIHHIYAKFSKAFLKGFMVGKREIGWLPTHQGGRLLRLGEVWIDDIEFFKQNFQKIRNHKIYPFLINYEVKCQNLLLSSEGEAKHFTYDQLFKDFPSLYYPQLTRDAYTSFINYLYERLKNTRYGDRQLKGVPFLVAKDGKLLSPKNALLEETENPIPNFFMVNTIDNKRLPPNNIESIKSWLAHLGARRLTPIQILRESILKWIDSGEFHKKINIDNCIEIMNYLAHGVKQLTNKETDKLKEKLLILTESNKFKFAKFCYFADVVSIKELSNIISDDEKISSSYDVTYLKEFLTLLGVKNTINPVEVLRRSILMWIKDRKINHKLTKDNYKPIIEFIALHFPTIHCDLTVSEMTELKQMPILTSGETFQKANVCYFDTAVPKIKGLESVVAKNKTVYNSSDSVSKFLTKIGVSKTMDAKDVIRRSVIKWIHEGNIEKKITKDNHLSILKYISENWSNLNSPSGLKTKEHNDLKKLPILTEGGVFKVANRCYWSNSNLNGNNYDEIPGLKYVISDDEFAFSGYNSKEIKNLLEELDIRKLTFTCIYEKYSDHLIHIENLKWFFSQLVYYWEGNKTKKDHDHLLCYLQQKFRASSCLPAKNGNMYPSTQLYSSRFNNIYDIDRSAILLFQYEHLPDNLEKYLGFKTDLDLKCIKQLLKAFGKKTELGKEKIRTFFTTILEQLRKKDRYEVKNSQLSLLSSDNTLKFAVDLNYFIEENAICSLKSCYLKRIFGMSHNETLELAELCGVNTIPFKQDIIRKEETLDDSLKEFYLEILPFIVLQESKYLAEDVISTLKNLYDTVSAIKFYQCRNIYVKYPFGDRTKVQQHFEGLTLYVDGKWYRKKSTIHEYLKEKLGLKTDIRDILDMGQPITQNDKDYWLSSQEEDSQKLHFVENLLRSFTSSKEKEQLEKLTPVEIMKNDQPHPHEENQYKSDTTDAETSSDEVSVNDYDDYHYTQKPDVPNGEFTYAESSSDEDILADDKDDHYLQNPNKITGKGKESIDSSKSEEIFDLSILPILDKLETNSTKRLLPEMPSSNSSSLEGPKSGLFRILPEDSTENAEAKFKNEKYVFTFLQQHYRKKYPNSLCTSNNEIFTLQRRLNKIEIVWVNANGEKGQSYDIVLKKQNEIKQLIEVKSINNMANKESFNISHQTFIKKSQLSAELSDQKEKYCIYLVLNTSLSATPNIEELKCYAALYKVVLLNNSCLVKM